MPFTLPDRLISESSGDIATLTSVCHDGLLTSFRTRINVRSPNESLQWTLHKYIGFPRKVSTNIATLEMEKSAVYQVVIKIKSVQSLEKIPANGSPSGTTEEREVVEYLVLQKIMLNGKEEKYKIWGTVEESKEDVLENDTVAATAAVGKQ